MSKIFVDIDGTICSQEKDYANAVPWIEQIEKINKLYDEGHTIIYWTARGSQTGIDWGEVTRIQLVKWGCKYHEVRFGKPEYDMFICDKSKRIEELL